MVCASSTMRIALNDHPKRQIFILYWCVGRVCVWHTDTTCNTHSIHHNTFGSFVLVFVSFANEWLFYSESKIVFRSCLLQQRWEPTIDGANHLHNFRSFFSLYFHRISFAVSIKSFDYLFSISVNVLYLISQLSKLNNCEHREILFFE